MWHYTEGIRNWNPIWAQPRHPDPARPVVAVVRRARPAACPRPLFPGFDTLGTLDAHHGRPATTTRGSCSTQQDHREGVRALRLRAEPRPHRQGHRRACSRARPARRARAGRRRSCDTGADFVVADTLRELVAGMNKLTDEPLLDVPRSERQIVARDRELDNPFTKDLQVMAIRNARSYLRRPAHPRRPTPHRILDPAAGPLIAVKLQHPHPQDARRPADRPVRPRPRRRRQPVRRACTRRARSRASAAAACTATARSRAPSSAAACSADARRAAPPPSRRRDPVIRRATPPAARTGTPARAGTRAPPATAPARASRPPRRRHRAPSRCPG